MAKEPRPWTVLPHEPIRKVEENLWTVEGALPRGPLRRRMAIVKRTDGRLVFHNGMPLQEPAMAELERWGEPAFLLVPNGWHRLDVHAFRVRYPKLAVLCPAEVDPRVRQAVPVNGHYDVFPPDPTIRLERLDGSKIGEAVVVVTSGRPARVSLIFADTLMNNPRPPGLSGLILSLLNSTGGPKVTGIAKMAAVSDRTALRRHLERLAELPGLARLSFSHGTDLESGAAEALRAAAAAL